MRLLILLLTGAMLLTANLTPMPRDPATDTAIVDDFDDGGFDGEWHTVEALDVEIFLPDGWTGEDATADGVCYRAASADGAATLDILYPVEAAAGGEVVSAGGRDARLTRGDDGSLTLMMALSDDRLVGFRFERTSEDALSEALALQIAGSCTDVW